MRCEQPWFLVRSLGEVQENIKYFRNADLDKIHANRAMLACGLHPDQHSPMSYCNCGPCQGIPAF
jgi:hypothetical protein